LAQLPSAVTANVRPVRTRNLEPASSPENGRRELPHFAVPRRAIMPRWNNASVS